MHIGIMGLAILGCIIWEEYWAIPFLIFGVEVCTGFVGSMVGWFSGMGDDDGH